MKSAMRNLSAAGFAMLLSFTSTVLAETTSYTGSGSYQGSVVQLTLANGKTVTGIQVDVLGTISTQPPALLYGRCMGMGVVPPEGEEKDYRSDFYCTFRQNDEDAFDIKGKDRLGDIDVEVIGGIGKWAGATGTGSIVSVRREVGSGDFTYEFEITTP